MENQITTINDLPDDVIKIILRMAIVSLNFRSYFCINKRFNKILDCMAKKYNKNDNYCCIICYEKDFTGPVNLIGIFSFYKTQILFDNICNDCFLRSTKDKCVHCNIDFINVKHKFNMCVNCREKRKLSVLNYFDRNNLFYQNLKCITCKCELLGLPIYSLNEIICRKCYDNIEPSKLIVSPQGFPYVINSYCPTL